MESVMTLNDLDYKDIIDSLAFVAWLGSTAWMFHFGAYLLQ
jgi:hypothetical protein